MYHTTIGGDIVSTFDSPGKVKIGSCKLIEEIMIGEDSLLRFSGVALGEACTIVIRGATQQILDEAERSLHDALCVLQQTVKETRVVYGGGWSLSFPLYPPSPSLVLVYVGSIEQAIEFVCVCVCVFLKRVL